MPLNAHPDYIAAEGKFISAQTDEERVKYLEEMIRTCPKHKSSENMLANLKTRYKKLKSQIEKSKKAGKGKQKGIKKEEIQAIIVGKTNTGKSSLLDSLTNAQPKISENYFTTTKPEIGMMPFSGTNIQLIENPAIESEFYDKGISHTTDILIYLIDKIEQIANIEKTVLASYAKKIIAFNKSDLLNANEKRKIQATLKSKYKKYPSILISTKNNENLEELKELIFQNSGKIRVHTKEPGKEKSPRPIILEPNSTVYDVAEKILHGYSKNVKETKIWGPSSKFAGQSVGLKHKLKDLDVVEFKTN